MGHDALRVHAGRFTDELHERSIPAEDGRRVRLALHGGRVGAVEVDCQVGHAGDGAGIHEVLRAIIGDHPSGKSQVSVQPRLQDWSAVHLHRHLAQALALEVRLRFGHQARRVRVGADDAEARARVLGDPPRDHGAAVDQDVAAGCGRVGGGGRRGVDKRKALRGECLRDVVRGVEGAGAGVEEVDEASVHTSTLRCGTR